MQSGDPLPDEMVVGPQDLNSSQFNRYYRWISDRGFAAVTLDAETAIVFHTCNANAGANHTIEATKHNLEEGLKWVARGYTKVVYVLVTARADPWEVLDVEGLGFPLLADEAEKIVKIDEMWHLELTRILYPY